LQSKTGAPGSFEQKGLVISSKAGSPYNAIDPFWVKDGWVRSFTLLVRSPKLILCVSPSSRQYLSFGSFWTGLWQIELNPKTGKVLDGAEPVHLSQRDISVEGAVEAPSVFKKGNAWFLVESWDKCCSGTKSTYNTCVVRSTSGVNGPYYDKDGVPALQGGGTLLLASEGAIIGPGGGSVYKDTDGSYYLYHHWYSDTTSSLGIRKLDFSSGWPVVM
jgi:arabinan endo-1,5-alpha-L-arabinosidase